MIELCSVLVKSALLCDDCEVCPFDSAPAQIQHRCFRSFAQTGCDHYRQYVQLNAIPFVIYKRTDKCDIAPLKDDDGLTYSEPAAKAEILNKQFGSVFTSDKPSQSLPDKGPSPYGSMEVIAVTTHGVYKLLAGIKAHKATGPDEIPGRLLKELASDLAPTFTTLYQASFNQGRVPDDWKIAFVTRILKKDNSNKAENYTARCH